jgi:hypothetical protein
VNHVSPFFFHKNTIVLWTFIVDGFSREFDYRSGRTDVIFRTTNRKLLPARKIHINSKTRRHFSDGRETGGNESTYHSLKIYTKNSHKASES